MSGNIKPIYQTTIQPESEYILLTNKVKLFEPSLVNVLSPYGLTFGLMNLGWYNAFHNSCVAAEGGSIYVLLKNIPYDTEPSISEPVIQLNMNAIKVHQHHAIID